MTLRITGNPVSVVTFLLLMRWFYFYSAEAFTECQTSRWSQSRTVTIRHSHGGDEPRIAGIDESNQVPSRRNFMSKTMGLVSLGLLSPNAIAADKSSANGNNAQRMAPVSKKAGGLANKIRGVCLVMDELQRDLMQERWDLVQNYPPQLRSFVPIFTTYTDEAFPSDLPSDYGLRVALRYEVGRLFASLERFKRAVARKALDEAYVAYADMSLHLDRYLRVGGLYTYYDSTIDNEPLFQAYNDALVYADPVKDPAEVRDLVVLCKGPDKGKTGIVIGIYPDGSNNCVVKLDKFRGMREIRVVPRSWAAKRLGEQDPDEVFLLPRKGSKT
mmetsp:Transcript_4823/g.14051  ORF Transcript_4823/g.14051 Transcript_4823/m.14051 type:complete len:329 (+) Transcript_4823:131-1117(+)